MYSLHTNTAAIGAQRMLRSNEVDLSRAQSQTSSGLRISTSADNAAYWSIATTIKSDNKALHAVQDGLGFGAAVIDTAEIGFSEVIDVMGIIKQKLVAAREPGVDRDKVNAELTELRAQVRSIAEASSFAGENWLHMTQAGQGGPQEVIASLTRSLDIGAAVRTIDYDMTSVPDTEQVFYIVDDVTGDNGIVTNSAFADSLGLTTDWVLFNGQNSSGYTEIEISNDTADSDIEEMISVVDAMTQKMIGRAATLGALQQRIDLQKEFNHDIGQAMERGVGKLVDADMNAVSARLRALQSQQELGQSSLSIANEQPQNILRLYS
ncbi:flagellin [Rhizobium sp. FKL33]|uniref:flagellin N-terminal helical domain-containing protein n=1 Tax=Rhizobium sp. FKL33 TaxID=2562307 RepID=UPI0010BFAF35|nr:flagellin [Rhizobium sp. FKL33]